MPNILISRAKSDLRMAKYGISTGDEYDLQMSAFHIQQCAEKILKVVIEEYGFSYAKTHEIAALIKQLPREQTLLSVETLEGLLRDEALLTKWERVTRYNDPYMATLSLVLELYDKVNGVLHELLTNLDKTKQQPSMLDGPPAVSVKQLNLFGDT